MPVRHQGRRAILRLAAAAALAGLVIAAGCTRRNPPPRPPGDAGPRAAVLSPALAVILRDLGLESSIVARHGFDMTLPRELPVVGDQAGIDYEALLRVSPTHVLLEWGARGLPPRLVSLAQERGWHVRNYPMLTLLDIRAAIRALPEDLHAGSDAQSRAAALLTRAEAAWSVRPGLREHAGRTLLLYSTDPPAAAGPGSFHAQVFEALGGASAITEGKPYITLDVEDVRRLDPDGIVLIMPGADHARMTDLLGRLGAIGLRALAQRRVLLLNGPLDQTPSTAMIDLADRLASGVLAWPGFATDRPGE